MQRCHKSHKKPAATKAANKWYNIWFLVDWSPNCRLLIWAPQGITAETESHLWYLKFWMASAFIGSHPVFYPKYPARADNNARTVNNKVRGLFCGHHSKSEALLLWAEKTREQNTCKSDLNRTMTERPNICYIFEKLSVQGCQIRHSHVSIPFNSAPAHSTRPHNAKNALYVKHINT